jgi:hypothetical protein
MLYRLFTSSLIVGLLSGFLACASALADNIRPACLEMEESDSGTIRVVWKVPRYQNIPDRFTPTFPQNCRDSSPRNRVVTGSAIIEMWNMACGDEGLAGAQICIDGLEETMTDALVRVRLEDGSVHREVLRPTQRVTTIPGPASKPAKGKGALHSGLGLLDRWLYFLLLPAAWLLSLRPRARRRGIVLCTVALVAGGLCGHALGRLPAHQNVLHQDVLSEAEATRILQGLMLNTYRAFMLDTDEEIYDYLARSVAGEFLNEVYLQNRQAMRMDETEGSSTLIDRLDIKSVESMKRLKDDGIAVVASWDVYGSVSHLGHIHYRCNTYRAELTMVPTENYWKLTSFQLLDEERVI